jgi:hypothetical protein
MASQDSSKFAGIWYCGYWYPSNQHEGEDVSEYYAKAYQRNNELILESLPNPSGAYIIVKLVIDGDLATGFWEESTALAGEFEGVVYSGAVQLLVSNDDKHMDGQWVGIGQEDGKRQIYTGRWEMHRAGSNDVAALDPLKKAM